MGPHQVVLREQIGTYGDLWSSLYSSTGHYRIILYHFSNLNFIVRYETDGYTNTDPKIVSYKAMNPIQDGLSSILGALSLSPAYSYPNSVSTRSKIIIKEEGKVIPLQSTLKIKTRVSYKCIETQEVAAQLWIAQTPKLV
jgi:hypothetical protein